jgi:hypothetical protein
MPLGARRFGGHRVRDDRRVLFPLRILEAIRDGRVDLAFRRWERPRVLPGSRLRTAVGVLEVAAVELVERSTLGEDEAHRAGFDSPDDLLSMLDERGRGEIYRIELRYAGADPRVELRNRADLSETEIDDVSTKRAATDPGRERRWS